MFNGINRADTCKHCRYFTSGKRKHDAFQNNNTKETVEKIIEIFINHSTIPNRSYKYETLE